MAVNLLDPNLGIQAILQQTVETNLPRARQIASNTVSEAGLEELYAPANTDSIIEDALRPDVGDGDSLQPDVFARTIEECVRAIEDALARGDDKEAQALMKDVLIPLMQNRGLLQAYTGLMLGG